jgi:hypothetical protein
MVGLIVLNGCLEEDAVEKTLRRWTNSGSDCVQWNFGRGASRKDTEMDKWWA